MTRFLTALLCASALVAPACAADLNATPATWWTVAKGAKPGDRMILKPGAYGDLRFDLFSFAAPGLTVVGGPGVKVNSLLLDTPVNLAFKGLEITGLYGNAAVTAWKATNVSFDSFHVHGQGQGVAFSLAGGTNVAITNSEIDHIGSGIGPNQTDHLTVANNNFHDLQIDGVLGQAVTYMTVSGNHFQDFHPQAGDHPDAIQFAGGPSGPSDHVIIADNVISRGSGVVLQGIFIENTNHMTITGNALSGTMFNGISLISVGGALVQGNFVQGFADMTSWISTNGGSDITVTGNTATKVKRGPSATANYVESGNRIIPAAALGDTAAMKTFLAAKATP